MTSELSNTSLSSGNSGQTDGSCLCGAVKFSISGPPLMKLLCHCVSCKKISGSLFQANNFYSISQLTISPLTDPNAIKTYVDKSPESGKGVHRTFCAVCGSRLWNTTPEHLGNVVVMVGSLNLNDEEWKKWTPEREFFCKRKGEWPGDGGAPEEGKTSEM
ncbi:Mss4-like protein [Leptodontidium sp. 2 PMI_412]|nr:Mss4-like protein [Leptodontidium sp. 2 PMI_412]